MVERKVIIAPWHWLFLLPGILTSIIDGISYGSLFLLGLGGIALVYMYLQKKAIQHSSWKKLKIAYLGVLAIFFTSFAAIEFAVMTGWNEKPVVGENFDYIIVLGAGLKKDTVSNRLRVRLDKGLEYAARFPAATLIMSGGKGSDEHISEAEAMRRYLVSQHFPPSRILLEDQSTSTVENLQFSKKLLRHPQAKVLIVSSDYHLFRALMLARRQGYDCAGAAAPSPLGIRLNYTIREYAAMLKDLFWI